MENFEPSLSKNLDSSFSSFIEEKYSGFTPPAPVTTTGEYQLLKDKLDFCANEVLVKNGDVVSLSIKLGDGLNVYIDNKYLVSGAKDTYMFNQWFQPVGDSHPAPFSESASGKYKMKGSFGYCNEPVHLLKNDIRKITIHTYSNGHVDVYFNKTLKNIGQYKTQEAFESVWKKM